MSGGVAGLGAELTACVLADKGAESGGARAAGEGSVHINVPNGQYFAADDPRRELGTGLLWL